MPRLLAKRRAARDIRRPPLSEEQILAWADAHFAARGKWPVEVSGSISGTNETWMAVASALRLGTRGLLPGSSLAQLLAKRRGVQRLGNRPRLTEQKIVEWAMEFFTTEGRWPSQNSGPIPQSAGDTWAAVDQALKKGCRGLPGGSSLPKLLRRHGLK